VHQRNLDNLTIWHNVGSDADYGYWAMAGARQGTYMTMLTNWDYLQVQNFDALAEIWQTVEHEQPEHISNNIANELHSQLDLPMHMLTVEASKFFKHHYRSNWRNRGATVRETDVIQQGC
jgi:hypothetical protein